jgi:hypothetical protein
MVSIIGAAPAALRNEIPQCAPSASLPPSEAGEQLYAQARNAVEHETYPRGVSYAIAVAASERGVAKTADYTALFRSGAEAVGVDAFSAQERARPHVARGANVQFKITLSMGGSATIFRKQLNRDEEPTEVLGVPQLAPNYMFGLVRRTAVSYADPPSLAADETLPVIGSVVARQRLYRITYAGSDTVADVTAPHLRLDPLRDPQRNRLREMWIDPANCAPVKMRISGNFTDTGTASVPWTITYQRLGGATYLDVEAADEPVTSRGHTYEQVMIWFRHVEERNLSSLDALNLDFRRAPTGQVLREP